MVALLATVAVAGATVPGADARSDRRQETAARGAAVPAAAALDCDDWRYGPADEPAPGVLPAEYDRNDYKRTSLRDPAFATSPQNQCGQKGAAVDLAWGVTKGRDDVLIAVLDSGIRWRSAGAMADLARKAYVNLAEASPPCASPTGDCNGDGVFDVADFGAIADLNGNGLADPEDLILDPAYNDGVDGDGNGWVDDISGWDLLYADNNPLDTVGYGHGTGEAEDSTAAENGTGGVGTCPRCRFLPVRVADSFIADGGRFAAGVLFALDSGADVVQEALGALNNPPQAQSAIDAAYRRGVVVVASMADEASKHPNLPASLEHTMAVNSVTEKESVLGGPIEGYLALNGCTNFGGHTFVSVPSGACSSEATGLSAGMVGLLESAARDARLARYPGLPRRGNRLSANEAMQVVRSTADDVDFSTPNAVDPANNFGTATGGLLDTVRYPTTAGWDATHGYGRINAYEMVRSVRDGRIPPEADITSPRWFGVLPVSGTLRVRGEVAAVRATSYDYRVEWTTGMQPPAHPGADVWHVAAERHGLHAPRSGVLARIDLADVAAALPGGAQGAPVDPATGRPDEERFAVRVRVVVTAHGGAGDGLTGEAQKQVFVHDDPDLRSGYPRRIAGVGTQSPVFADIDGRPGDEMIVGSDDGQIHALDRNGRDLLWWPVRSEQAPYWSWRSRTARHDFILPPGSAFLIGAPAIADLDGDGTTEIVAADLDGNVWVWNRNGMRRAGFRRMLLGGRVVSQAHVDPRYSLDDPAVHDEHNRTKRGIAGAPALGDLDGDGRLEIVVAALDRHVYAWNDDGTPVPGFPVLVVDPAKVSAVDPVTHSVTFSAGSGVDLGGELVATPALADLTGDGRPEIVVGAQEQYREAINAGTGGDVLALLSVAGSSGNSRLYAISPDGAGASYLETSAAHPHEQAYLPGWPFKIPQLVVDVLPTIGDGVSAQAAIGDVYAADPGPEIVAASSAGPLFVLNELGQSVYGSVGGKAVPAVWSAGVFRQNAGQFGALRSSDDIVASLVGFAGPSIGRLGASPGPVAPTVGFSRFLDLLASDLQPPNDDQITAWDGDTGRPLAGFPQATSDLAFFVTPAVADLDADGNNEAIAGTGVYLADAFEADGSRPEGWPKLTGGWLVGTPGLGDLDGDGTAELAVVRRDGVLLVWETAASPASLTEWPRFGHDARNTGARPPTP